MAKCENMKAVKLFLTDVDGCLTDGGMYYTAEGDAMKRFCVYDGMGIVLLRQAGIPCGILTSEQSPIVKARADKLKLDFLYLGVGTRDRQGSLTKLEAAKRICAKLDITLDDVCYVCPPNARPEVKALSVANGAKADIRILSTPGGEGAIREIADTILAARNNG